MLLHQASAFWRDASAAPMNSATADMINPRSSPPGPSAIHPTRTGPTIWPSANTTVNTLIADDQDCCGRLCRTSTVVDATAESSTAPKATPETNTIGTAAVSAGKIETAPAMALKIASDSPPLKRSSIGAQSRDDATTATPSSV